MNRLNSFAFVDSKTSRQQARKSSKSKKTSEASLTAGIFFCLFYFFSSSSSSSSSSPSPSPSLLLCGVPHMSLTTSKKPKSRSASPLFLSTRKIISCFSKNLLSPSQQSVSSSPHDVSSSPQRPSPTPRRSLCCKGPRHLHQLSPSPVRLSLPASPTCFEPRRLPVPHPILCRSQSCLLPFALLPPPISAPASFLPFPPAHLLPPCLWPTSYPQSLAPLLQPLLSPPSFLR
jgi:hypothetical protein